MTEPTLLPCELSPLSGTTSLSKPHFGSTLPELETGTPVPVFDSPCGKRAKGKVEGAEKRLQYLESFAAYSPELGEFVATRQRTHNAPSIGSILGSKSDKSKVLTLGKTLYKIHHLVWLWHYGIIPAQIDHIDGNPFNNKITNLRAVDQSLNLRNKRKSSNNTSGITGVTWATKDSKWKAQVSMNRKCIFLGNFDNKEEAAQARQTYLDNNPQLGFTARHGK